jgi:hypothetical protein
MTSNYGVIDNDSPNAAAPTAGPWRNIAGRQEMDYEQVGSFLPVSVLSRLLRRLFLDGLPVLQCGWRIRTLFAAIFRQEGMWRLSRARKNANIAGFFSIISRERLQTELVGWGGRIRTSEWRNQNPLPYHLATPQCFDGMPQV